MSRWRSQYAVEGNKGAVHGAETAAAIRGRDEHSRMERHSHPVARGGLRDRHNGADAAGAGRPTRRCCCQVWVCPGRNRSRHGGRACPVCHHRRTDHDSSCVDHDHRDRKIVSASTDQRLVPTQGAEGIRVQGHRCRLAPRDRRKGQANRCQDASLRKRHPFALRSGGDRGQFRLGRRPSCSERHRQKMSRGRLLARALAPSDTPPWTPASPGLPRRPAQPVAAHGSPWRPAQPVATRGSEDRTRTPMGCCGSTFPNGRAWPGSPRPTSTRSATGSTGDLDRSSA
jgi:hypothetical protein